jgi:hypothetical protein
VLRLQSDDGTYRGKLYVCITGLDFHTRNAVPWESVRDPTLDAAAGSRMPLTFTEVMHESNTD